MNNGNYGKDPSNPHSGAAGATQLLSDMPGGDPYAGQYGAVPGGGDPYGGQYGAVPGGAAPNGNGQSTFQPGTAGATQLLTDMPGGDPYAGQYAGQYGAMQGGADPYGGQYGAVPGGDPYADQYGAVPGGADPYGGQYAATGEPDPYGGQYAATGEPDPYGGQYAADNGQFVTPPVDPGSVGGGQDPKPPKKKNLTNIILIIVFFVVLVAALLYKRPWESNDEEGPGTKATGETEVVTTEQGNTDVETTAADSTEAGTTEAQTAEATEASTTEQATTEEMTTEEATTEEVTTEDPAKAEEERIRKIAEGSRKLYLKWLEDNDLMVLRKLNPKIEDGSVFCPDRVLLMDCDWDGIPELYFTYVWAVTMEDIGEDVVRLIINDSGKVERQLLVSRDEVKQYIGENEGMSFGLMDQVWDDFNREKAVKSPVEADIKNYILQGEFQKSDTDQSRFFEMMGDYTPDKSEFSSFSIGYYGGKLYLSLKKENGRYRGIVSRSKNGYWLIDEDDAGYGAARIKGKMQMEGDKAVLTGIEISVRDPDGNVYESETVGDFTAQKNK